MHIEADFKVIEIADRTGSPQHPKTRSALLEIQPPAEGEPANPDITKIEISGLSAGSRAFPIGSVHRVSFDWDGTFR